MNALGQGGTIALPSTFARPEEDTAMTILRRSIKRELPERIAHRQMVVELHPGFVRFREKHSRTAWDISWESHLLEGCRDSGAQAQG